MIGNYTKKTDQTFEILNKKHFKQKFGKNHNIFTKNKSAMVSIFAL